MRGSQSHPRKKGKQSLRDEVRDALLAMMRDTGAGDSTSVGRAIEA